MSIFDRGLRGNVQNPFIVLDAGTTAYTNPRLPTGFGGNVQLAIDYLLDGMYPNYKGTVATPAALPLTAAANDFYIVSDDGDGKSAGYVYSVLQGATQWIKRYDVDWSYEQILSDTITRTGYMYAAKLGTTDKDAAGLAITGLYAGQKFYGGDQTAQNLTLIPNAFDTTGFVQTDAHFRPTADNTLDLGTSALKFRAGYFGTSVDVGTLHLASGAIADSSGALSFGATNLQTTGTLAAGNTTISSTLVLKSGDIHDTSGAISFGATDLTTAGKLTAATNSQLADITFTNGTFNTLSAVFSFSSKNVGSIGTLTSSKVVTDEVDVGSLVLSGQTLTTTAPSTALILQAGTGGNTTTVQVNSAAQVNFDLAVSGKLAVSGSAASSIAGPLNIGSCLQLKDNTGNGLVRSVTGDLQLSAQSGSVAIASALKPDVTATRDIGASTLKFRDLYVGGVSDGTNKVDASVLASLRGINTGVNTGMGIFWDGAQWTPSAPDLEVDHTTILNLTLGDSGHTQFAMLAGRAGGQTIQGGTAASENLTLDSTSHVTKGFVLVSSKLAPSSDALLDLGSSSRNFKDIYSKGIHYGLRLDQYAGSGNYPANSGSNIGRVIFDTTKNILVVDSGSSWATVGGSQKYVSDTVWNGAQTTQTFTVSGSVDDARSALWQFMDNANEYERIYAKITLTQTQVTVTVSPALPAGSYRLIGIN